LVIAIFTVGIFKFVAGKFGLLRLTDYIPYPVVCGLMAGIGFNVTYLSIELSTHCELQYVLNFLPALVVGVLNIAANKYGLNPAISFTLIISISISVFYGFLFFSGYTIQQAEDSNWIFGFKTAASRMWVYPINEAPYIINGLVDFGAIWNHCTGDFISIASLIVLKTSLTIPAYEKALKKRFNKSLELSKYGLATLISAPFGAAGTCPGITILSVIVQMKGSERIPTYLTPIIFGLWFFTRFSFVPYAPKFIFAGLLLSSGYHILVSWFVLPFYRIPRLEWGIVVSIVMFFQLFGMLSALVNRQISVFLALRTHS